MTLPLPLPFLLIQIAASVTKQKFSENLVGGN
jgi:hypothetical protein